MRNFWSGTAPQSCYDDSNILCLLRRLCIGEYAAVTLLALALEAREVQQCAAPDKLRPYSIRDTIDVVIETIAAVLDNGKILRSGPAIRRASSPTGAQEGYVVVMNVVALSFVVAAGLTRAILVD